MNKREADYIPMALNLVQAINEINKYCIEDDGVNGPSCEHCPLNGAIDDCDVLDVLKDNVIAGLEKIINDLKR